MERTRYEREKVGGHLKQERTVNAKMGESAKFRAGSQGETFPFPTTRAVHSSVAWRACGREGVHSALHCMAAFMEIGNWLPFRERDAYAYENVQGRSMER